MTFREKIASRTFFLALIFSIGGTYGLFDGKINSSDYYLLAGAVLAGFASNKWAEGKKNDS